MSSTAGAEDVLASEKTSHHKRIWIKYYCEECKAWETRELFEAKLGHDPQPSPGTSALWSWGCSKLIHYGSFKAIRVDQLNNADGHDAEPKLDFPGIESPAAQPSGERKRSRSPEAAEEGSAPHSVHPAQSNGSSQSKRRKRNVRSTYLGDSVAEAGSPINSHGVVTSSSPDQVLPEENGASTVHVENRSKNGEAAADTARPESPAVIDAEHNEYGVHKRPRRLTAGDRGLAQALQYEKPARATTKPLAEVNNVKPSQPSLAAMKRPKRVTAGLRGILISAENAKSAPRVSPKERKTAEAQGVRTRSTAKKTSKKNRKLGDLY